MSVVTGIIAAWSVGETGVLGRLNECLKGLGFPGLRLSEHCFGGDKHPQLECAGAGINHFASGNGRFVEYFITLPWQFPENAVLVLQPEDGLTEVFRPKNWTTSSTGERTDIDRMNWLEGRPDELESVRGRVNNEGCPVRDAIDYFMRIRPHQ